MRHLRRLGPYFRAQRLGLALALFAALVSSVLVMMSPVLVGWAIDFGLDPVRDGTGTVTQFEGSETFLVMASLAIVVFAIGRGLTAFAQQYMAESSGQRIAYAIRNDIYQNLQRLSYAYHDRTHTGQIMSRATQDVENIRQFVAMAFVRGVYVAILLSFAIIGMLIINWQLALVSMVTLPFVGWRSMISNNRQRPLWRRIQENQAVMTQIAEEGLSGIRVVKAFSQEDFESAKFRKAAEDQADLSYEQARIQARTQPVMTGLSMLQVAITVGFGGYLIAEEQLSAGALLTFVLWLSLLQMPVRTLGFLIAVASRAASSAERVLELLDARSAVQEKPGAATLQATGHVRFEDVAFSYNAASPVLDAIDIDAPPGQVVALLGPTGSGKSTIVNLIPRFYDVTRGRITIDGVDVRDVTLDSLRRTIGIVQQDVFLFLGTIRDNIAYGRPDATMEEVIEAAKAARIHDFIDSLPYGYDEWVGENGVTLSGGQKQRIAIARTLLLDPRILIFDDSTSSVDAQTEYLIQQALQELMRGRTTFVIAQRLRTVREADEIIVLDHGRVVQRGTHEQLLEEAGLYRTIYELELKVSEHGYEEQPSGNGHGNGNGHLPDGFRSPSQRVGGSS